MTRVNVKGVGPASVGVLVVLAWLVGGGLATPAGEAAQAEQTKWPPQFPREGATKLFENDYIIVWEQIGRPKEPFAHQHIRDILTFRVQPGQVEVFGPDLQRPTASQGGGRHPDLLTGSQLPQLREGGSRSPRGAGARSEQPPDLDLRRDQGHRAHGLQGVELGLSVVKPAHAPHHGPHCR